MLLDSLPDDSLLLNRPLSYFEVHRSIILTSLGVISILGIIIVLLLQNVRRQRTINQSNVDPDPQS